MISNHETLNDLRPRVIDEMLSGTQLELRSLPVPADQQTLRSFNHELCISTVKASKRRRFNKRIK